MTTCLTLTEDQVRQFLDHGFIRLSGCFDADFATPLVRQAYDRLGYDPDDSSTWERERSYLDHLNRFRICEVSPECWGAICDILGGEDRIRTDEFAFGKSIHFTTVDSCNWSDAFIINFKYGADRPWEPPSASTPGWHKDGGYFRHFLDSPEQALLMVIYWTDVEHRSGGTFVIPDSVKPIARRLLDHPEGIVAGGFGDLAGECSDFQELLGKTGDVFICHPFMLHTSSPNHSGRPRFMTNPPVALNEPMCFDRDDPDDYSPLERSILNAVELERLDFRPTGRREIFSPVEGPSGS